MVVTADLLVSYKNTTDEDYLRKILLSLLTKGDDEVKSAVKSFLQRLVDAGIYITIKLLFIFFLPTPQVLDLRRYISGPA